MNKIESKISDNVLKQIKDGQVKMRPSIYFSLLSVGIIFASLVAGVTLAYSSSIIFFWFKIVSSDSGAYGAKRNLGEALAAFPWWTILILAIAIALIVFLVRKYGTVYRHKTRNIILLILLISLISGLTMSFFDIGDYNRSNQNIQQNGRWIRNN